MRTVVVLFLILALTLSAAAPVPRPAPELRIHPPTGADYVISAQKGKVVIVQFLFTWCPHCQNAAKWLSDLQTEMGPKGLQVLGLAVQSEPAATPKDVIGFAQYGKFPVGIGQASDLTKFMGFSVMDRYGVPQLVVIDKKGVIRAQTTPSPKAGEIVEPAVMKALVTKLLAEK